MKAILRHFNIYQLLKIVYGHRSLLKKLVKRNLEARYKESLLGFLWSFIHPMLMLIVYTFVFGIVFKARWGTEAPEQGGVPFAIIMFCGMAVFNIFSDCVNTAPGVIVGNSSYVKKVVFPLEILPITTLLTSMIFGLAWFVLLLLGFVIFVEKAFWSMLLLPVTLFPMLLLTQGLVYLLSSLGVYLRDVQHVVGVITQILFFGTPIFYPVTMVPQDLQWVLLCNPLSGIIEETRKILLYGIMPDWEQLAILYLISLISLVLGYAWFSKTKKGFADVL